MLNFLHKERGRAKVSLKICYSTLIRVFNVTGESIRLNHIKLPTFDLFFFNSQKWPFHIVKSNRYERKHKAIDFKWLLKKKKRIKYLCGADRLILTPPVWSAGPCEGWATLAICRADWLPSWLPATTCCFDNCSFRATRTCYKTPGIYRQLKGSRGPSYSDQRTLRLLMVLLASRETTSLLWHSHTPDQRHLDFSHYSSCTWSHSEN